MKRFITVAARHGEEVLVIMRNAAAGAAGVDAYQWLKKQLQGKQVPHQDQQARHQNELPQQGGFVSFYVDNGKWMRIDH